MRFFIFLFLTLGLSGFSAAESIPPVGFRSLNLPGMEAVVWYPTQSSAPVTRVGENPVFVGVRVVQNAEFQKQKHPVVLLSHGYSGLWRNQAWLAARLAHAGHIVVSLNHSGTTFGDLDPSWATQLSARPGQISRLLDVLLTDDSLSSWVDPSRITVIGHSLGGWTALAMSGGLFDPDRMIDACGNSTEKMVCTVFRQGGMTRDIPVLDARDPRISATVLLGMEGIHGFVPESLDAISTPVLALVAGVEDPGLPLEWESRTQVRLLPAATTRYVEVIGATHFSFMSECKPGAEALLGDEAFVCKGETAPRVVLHDEIAAMVIRFLNAENRLESAPLSP